MKKSFFLILILIAACSVSDNERPGEWRGDWKAYWETPPESYPGIDGVDFTMDGIFEFNGDSMTITAYGYPGCIFHADTIKHTQSWKIGSDTLFLYSDPEAISMTYIIQRLNADSIRLQLMDDIFITLTR
jgi:hypothetical protein